MESNRLVQHKNEMEFTVNVGVSTAVNHLLCQPWTVFLLKILMSRLESHSTAPGLSRVISVSTHQLAFCDIVSIVNFFSTSGHIIRLFRNYAWRQEGRRSGLQVFCYDGSEKCLSSEICGNPV